MNVRYIHPFIEAVQLVFGTMLGQDIVISRPCLKSRYSGHPQVSARIDYSGSATGSVSLCLSYRTACRIASAFADRPLSMREADDISDALGELANMVAGQAKSQLPESEIRISLPRVFIGEQHPVSRRREPVLLLPCDSQLGRFSVEVTTRVGKTQPYASRTSNDAPAAK